MLRTERDDILVRQGMCFAYLVAFSLQARQRLLAGFEHLSTGACQHGGVL